MKHKKLILGCLIVLVLIVCLVPIPKKIDGSFPCMNQDRKDIVVTVKGTYYNYLIRKDQFKGVLIDEKGFEYPSIEKQRIEPDTFKDKTTLGIHFAYIDFEDEMRTYFASAYFEENLEEIYYCVLMD